jgi:hypothetical protein
MMQDTLIPIVYTEYLIAVPSTKLDLPRMINDWGIPDIETPKKLSDLGHAAVLFINGKTGLTKYYEYGRYDAAGKGEMRRKGLPDLRLDKSSAMILESLKGVLASASKQGGQGGKIKGAFIEVPGKFSDILSYVDKRLAANKDPTRPPYSLISNSCLHLIEGAMKAAGLSPPLLLDPRPVSYIDEIRSSYRDLDFDPRTGKLTIEK